MEYQQTLIDKASVVPTKIPITAPVIFYTGRKLTWRDYMKFCDSYYLDIRETY